MDTRYDILFRPMAIGPVTAKNRFYAVAHSAGMGYGMPHATAALRGMKAEGGWGVVSTGVVEIDETSDMMGHQNDRLWDEHDVACHRLATDAIHAHGALAAVELAHLGLGARNLYSRVPSLGPASLKTTSPRFVPPTVRPWVEQSKPGTTSSMSTLHTTGRCRCTSCRDATTSETMRTAARWRTACGSFAS